jgi:diguanylate cyclase (GGDEF)-like protein/PAS domain S-box-containing protein
MTSMPRQLYRFLLRSPPGIVLLYAVFAALWITLSDNLLIMLVRDPETIGEIGRLKGYFFVASTATLLYLLLHRWHRSMAKVRDAALDYKDRLERALTGSNDGWWDWNLRANELFYSPRWWHMLGYAVDELPSDAGLWRRLMHPDDLPRAEALMNQTLASPDVNACALEIQLRHKSGHYVPVLTRYMVQRDAVGRAVRVSGTNSDITERRQAEERLRQAATVFETTCEGVMVTDAAGRITMVNHAFSDISGYAEQEVLGQPSMLLGRSRDGEPDIEPAVAEALKANGYWRGEIWNRRKSGEVYPELLSINTVKDNAGAVINYVGVFADISKLKESENRLDFLAYHDPLTQLPNRLKLMAGLEHAIKSAQRESTGFALLMLDLDRFKDVNDSYGHAAGDELLCQVAASLAARLRGADIVARLGGDEFIVLLENIGALEDAGQVAHQIIESLSHPWQLSNGVEVRVGTSIGISIFPEHGGGTEELLQHADAALYQAKKEGRACFRYFSEQLTRAARERIRLEARLHQAIEREELRVYYQPQIDMQSGRIVGVEALVRWQDPLAGLIGPNHFIPAAEACGLIGAIGQWMLWQTCRQGQRWLAAGFAPLTLAVNLSPRQFLHDDIGALIERVLSETGFPADCLELELTESGLMECGADVVEILQRLRALGVRLAIDDFGTGYSSLAYLKNFPLDVLKIDRSFVRDIPFHCDDMAICTAIVTMGHALGFKVLAEGVETEEQLGFLTAQGCDLYQGYLASRPVPVEVFEAMLKAEADAQLAAAS